jgi:putative inorganic carbon (hco3(-)) transporter
MNYLYYLLFFLTPFLFYSNNSELFELPKMYFVYALTLIILITHCFQYLRGKTVFFRPTFLDWPLLIFIVSQTVSTVFSVDVHTSIFGYYSRLNGGLLSLFAYAILYWILAAHIDDKFKDNLVKLSLLSGLLIAAYGIAQHFGIDKDIWVQDVQARVFSTLGQPNWLAAFLCILLPFSVDKLLSSKTKPLSTFYLLLSTTFYLCLLFTKSKSGIIAAIVSLAVYFIIRFFQKNLSLKHSLSVISLFIVLSLIINNPIKDIIFPPKIIPTPVNNTINITPSEDIRQLVWAGSFRLWQQFPLFGTGPETFAYTYYWVRPAAHNLTSEWNFLYNKSHNEYLNYLATTGSFGIVAYLLIIGITLFNIKKSPVLLSSFLSILITNSVGFSVVIVALWFYLLPALSLSASPLPKPKLFLKVFSTLFIFVSVFLFIKNLYYYLADLTYSQAVNFDNSQQYSAALGQIQLSLQYRSNEPVYLIKAADLSAKLAVSSKDKKYVTPAINYLDRATKISPFSVNLWKERSQVYYYLSSLDTNYYLYALDALTKATKLAPTDAASYYMLGQFYSRINATDQAIKNYQSAIDLKSNYDYAYFALGQIYLSQKKYDLAKPLFESTLQIAPNNVDAQNYLLFIATQSAGKK